MNRDFALLFVLGVVVAGVSQQFVPTGWWLNSATGVRMTLIVFLTLAAIVGYALPRIAGESPVPRIMLLWSGVMAGLAVTLFAMGPGSIFPIVLMFTAVMSGAAVSIGAAAGLGLRSLTHRASL